jgi:hypothetical protein
MPMSEHFRYRNDVFQSDIFVSDIGITDVDGGCWISPILRSIPMPTYAVYIQGLYTVYNSAGVRSTVPVLSLATNQGRRH